MFTKSEIETFRKAISTFGENSQLVVAMEEMSELSKELCKSIRYNRQQYTHKVAEEIADCEIMFAQLKLIYKIEEEVEMWRLDKTVRLKERLGELPDYCKGGDN